MRARPKTENTPRGHTDTMVALLCFFLLESIKFTAAGGFFFLVEGGWFSKNHLVRAGWAVTSSEAE